MAIQAPNMQEIYTTLHFGNYLHGGSFRGGGVLLLLLDRLGAADGASAALAQPRVQALRVEPVAAPRQHTAPVARAERIQTHRALATTGALLELMARQLANLLGRKASTAAFFLLRVLRHAAGGALAEERPADGDAEMEKEHQHEADSDEDDAVWC